VSRYPLLLAAACLLGPDAWPYIRTRGPSGNFVIRTDFANVRFLLNEDAIPGVMNIEGKVMITAESDVLSAVRSAESAWNSVGSSAARFATLDTTDALNNSFDGRNVIVVADTPSIRSAMGAGLASLTLVTTSSSGNIIDTDILLNPTLTFSTNGTPDTYDLQAVLTKALGNSLGASNSGVIGAALFYATGVNSLVQRSLSPEDMAFVSAVYPSSGGAGGGTLSGTLTMQGRVLRNALISIADPDAGSAFTTLTDFRTGAWSLVVPPGNYVVYAQPLNDPALPYLLAIPSNQTLDTNFQPTFYGGNNTPVVVTVNAGDSVRADFSAAALSDETQPVLYSVSALPAGGRPGDVPAVFPYGFSKPIEITSGRSFDISVMGPGIDGTLADGNILLLGPLTLRQGSVTVDNAARLDLNGTALPAVRFTIDVPPLSAPAYGSLIVFSRASFASYTGGFVVSAAQ
jgi:hypothetical protein